MGGSSGGRSDGSTARRPAEVTTLEEQLAALGLRATEARVLVALLLAGSGTAGTLSRAAHIPRPGVYAVLDNLVDLGVAFVRPGRRTSWTVGSRDEVLGLLLARQQEQRRLDEQRSAQAAEEVRRLLPASVAATPPFVRVLDDPAHYRQVYELLLREARTEVLSCSRPPYSWTAGEPNVHILEALGRISSGRALVEGGDLLRPEAAAFRSDADAYVRAGLQLRLVDALPLKIAIVDRARALVTLDAPAEGDADAAGPFPTAMLVDHAGYAAFAAQAFEFAWLSARPYDPEASP